MDNILVTIPNICTSEVKYVFHCLLNVFLGLEYTITSSKSTEKYVLSYGDRRIKIENHFFHSDDLSILISQNSMPSISTKSNCNIGGIDYPFVTLYGNEEVEISEMGVHMQSDIIAATYFMLTRWEEDIVKIRDEHNRFPGRSSFAFCNSFLDRPIVNEYIELLWNCLVFIGYDKVRKQREFKIVPTHDIDDPLMWMSNVEAVRSIMFSTFKSPSVSQIWKKVKGMIQSRDPYDTYDILMDMAESIETTAIFYILSGGATKFDRAHSINDPRLRKIIQRIESRQHLIGIHPSYDTCENIELLEKEKSNFTNNDIQHSRQHYLRMSVPITFTLWQEAGLRYDSTLGYADASGFRCGICYSFPLFDYRNRKQLDVFEQPLIIMDVTLQQYELLRPLEAKVRIDKLKSAVKKYDGDFVFLWHNSSFFTTQWNDFEEVFTNLYN